MKPYFKALIDDLNKIPLQLKFDNGKKESKKFDRFEHAFKSDTKTARCENLEIRSKQCKISFYGMLQSSKGVGDSN